MSPRKLAAAVALGRRGANARWATRDAAQRSEEMRQVAAAGWASGKRPRAKKPRKRKAPAP